MTSLRREAESESGLVTRLKKVNAKVLEWGFARVRSVLIATAIVSALAIGGALLLPRAFLPTFNEGSFVVGYQLEPGISLEASSQLASTAEKLLLQMPEVESVSRRTGPTSHPSRS